MKNEDYPGYEAKDLVLAFYFFCSVIFFYALCISENQYKVIVCIGWCFVSVGSILTYIICSDNQNVPSKKYYEPNFYYKNHKSNFYNETYREEVIKPKIIIKKDIYDSELGTKEKMKCNKCKSNILVRNKLELKCVNCGSVQPLFKSKETSVGMFLGDWEEQEIRIFEADDFFVSNKWNFMKCPNIYSAWNVNSELQEIVFGSSVLELIQKLKDKNVN